MRAFVCRGCVCLVFVVLASAGLGAAEAASASASGGGGGTEEATKLHIAALSAGSPGERLSLLERAVAADGEHVPALRSLAVTLGEAGRLEEAAEVLERTSAILRGILASENRNDEAGGDGGEGESRGGSSAGAAAEDARAPAAPGRPYRADASVLAEVLYNHGATRGMLGDHRRAAEALEEASAVDPGLEGVHDTLADALTASGMGIFERFAAGSVPRVARARARAFSLSGGASAAYAFDPDGEHASVDILPRAAEAGAAYQGLFRTRQGLMLALAHDPHTGAALARYGEHGRASSSLLSFLARPGSTVVEVGAGHGSLTVPLARAVGLGGTVLALEPSRVHFTQLCANLALNSVRAVRPMQAAAGSAEHSGKYVETVLASPHSPHALAEGDGPWKAREVVDAPPRALDDREAHADYALVLAVDDLPLSSLDLLVVDDGGRGAARDILSGAKRAIADARPMIYVRVAESPTRRPDRARGGPFSESVPATVMRLSEDDTEAVRALLRHGRTHHCFWHRYRVTPSRFRAKAEAHPGRLGVRVYALCIPKDHVGMDRVAERLPRIDPEELPLVSLTDKFDKGIAGAIVRKPSPSAESSAPADADPDAKKDEL